MKRSSWLVCAAVAASAAPALADGPTMYPGSRRYAERNPSAATGRSGNATVAARALLSKTSGATVLDVSSGDLDATSPPPGTLTKVQVKGYNGAGDVSWTNNYTSGFTGGSAHYTYTTMQRGQPYQVQANLKGIDGKRSDVVTVSGSVKLRPDLSVAINAPSEAIVGTAVNVVALVSEHNGDTGATARCSLFLDGASTAADRVTGMWIDGNDAVSCAFTVSFDTVGTHTLRAVVDDVVPADDDTADNTATASIAIVANTSPNYWWAFTTGNRQTRAHYKTQGAYNNWDYDGYSNGSDYDYSYDYPQSYDDRRAGIWAYQRVEFPVDVNVTQTSGDRSLFTFSGQVTPDLSWGDSSYGGSAATRYDAASNTWVYVQSYQSGDYVYFAINTQSNAGAVTYYGEGYARAWWSSWYWGGGSYYYSYNGSWSSSWGVFADGSSVDTHFQCTNGSVTFDSVATVAVNRLAYSNSRPWSCSSWNYGGMNIGNQCYEYEYTGTSWYAYASGFTP